MSQEYIELSFFILNEGKLFCGKYESQNQCLCSYENGVLIFSIYYDKRESPLSLSANACKGDKVRIALLSYRIELYVNDKLVDEEWPYGNHKLENCVFDDCGNQLYVSNRIYTPKEEPTVIGSFNNAEGWKPEENVFVGDCMPFSFEDTYHVLYLKDRHHHKSKWCLGAHQWSHISTKDFTHWDIHPMAVEIDSPDIGSICTGSWIYYKNRHYLFYTVRTCDGSPAKICRSISDDGYHFVKDRNFSFTLTSKYKASMARDPKIILADDGIFHMILTTSLVKEELGCLAHLTSKDLETWEELSEPIYIAPRNMGEPECPDYIHKDGFYYLVYSLKGKGYYQYSKKSFSEWKTPNDPIIPCKSVPKAAVWKNRMIFSGFDGNGVYAGTLTFLEAKVNLDGELSFVPIS